MYNKKDEQMSDGGGAAAAISVAMLPINTLEKYFYCKQLNTLLYGMNF